MKINCKSEYNTPFLKVKEQTGNKIQENSVF